jgi:uncharacterized cupin superfamily protein
MAESQAQKPPCAWAELHEVQRGDARLLQRLIALATTLAENPEESLPQACGTWAATKGAYRLLDNDQVEFAAVLAGHRQATLRRIMDRDPWSGTPPRDRLLAAPRQEGRAHAFGCSDARGRRAGSCAAKCRRTACAPARRPDGHARNPYVIMCVRRYGSVAGRDGTRRAVKGSRSRILIGPDRRSGAEQATSAVP